MVDLLTSRFNTQTRGLFPGAEIFWQKQWMLYWLCGISTSWPPLFSFLKHLSHVLYKVKMMGIWLILLALIWRRWMWYFNLIRLLADAPWACILIFCPKDHFTILLHSLLSRAGITAKAQALRERRISELVIPTKLKAGKSTSARSAMACGKHTAPGVETVGEEPASCSYHFVVWWQIMIQAY